MSHIVVQLFIYVTHDCLLNQHYGITNCIFNDDLEMNYVLLRNTKSKKYR